MAANILYDQMAGGSYTLIVCIVVVSTTELKENCKTLTGIRGDLHFTVYSYSCCVNFVE